MVEAATMRVEVSFLQEILLKNRSPYGSKCPAQVVLWKNWVTGKAG